MREGVRWIGTRLNVYFSYVSNLHEDWGLRRDLWDGVCTFLLSICLCVYVSICLFVYGCVGVWVYGCGCVSV